jgi:divalent metal cation (Fe/Co/Zn/Cd) transporter
VSAAAPVSDDAVDRVERRGLLVAKTAMAFFAVSGFTAYYLSDSAAVQIDGYYSLINFASAVIAGYLAKVSRRSPSREYPYGRAAVENVYVMFRSIVLLGLVAFALIENTIALVDYFDTGTGEEPDFTIVAVYGGSVAVICLLLIGYYGRLNRSVDNRSEVLKVERRVAIIDGTLSLGIAVGLGAIALLPEGTPITEPPFDLKIVGDKIIVIILALLLLAEPYAMLRRELGRLIGRRVDPDVEQAAREAVQGCIDAGGGVRARMVDLYAVRRGKSCDVDVRVAFEGSATLEQLEQFKHEVGRAVRDRVGSTRTYVIYDAEPIHHSTDLD